MKSSYRIISLLLCIIMMLSVVPFAVFAGDGYPEATITSIGITDANRTSSLYVATKSTNYSNLKIGTVNVGVLYNFEAQDTSATINDSPYKDWFCDFVVTFDKAIPKQSMGLIGSYGDYINIAFLMPIDISAGTEIYLLKELGLDSQLTYKEVVNLVESFTCGAFNLWDGNKDTNMSVSLVIFQKDASKNVINRHTVATRDYKLTDKTNVETTYGTFRYGGVGLHEKGWVLKQETGDKFFRPQNESNTYFLSGEDETKEDITYDTEVPVKQDVDSEIKATVNDNLVVEHQSEVADNKVVKEVVDDITNNQSITTSSSDIQDKIDETVVDNSVDKTAQLKIDLESVNISTVQAQQEAEQTITTTNTATYDVKPYVTITTIETQGEEEVLTVEQRLITNEELAAKNITVNFKLPVPTTMTGNTVQVTHKETGKADESWTAKVEGEGSDRYVSISATSFSQYELSQVTSENAVAMIKVGETNYYYTDIASAVSDALDGDTITLLADITESVTIDKNIIVDSNKVGGTWEFNYSVGTRCQTPTISDGKYTFTYIKYVIATTSRTVSNAGTITSIVGGGSYTKNDLVEVFANNVDGYSFVGWYEDSVSGTPVCTTNKYTFNATKDCTLIAVYEATGKTLFVVKINGAEYTVEKNNDNNPKKQTGLTNKTYAASTLLTITYEGDDGFLYWVNASDNILSTTPEYTMSVVCDTEIRAVTHGNTTDDESAYVVFHNAFDQILSSSRYYEDENVTFPSYAPSKMGYTFDGWGIKELPIDNTYTEATQDSIIEAMATYDVINVIPLYSKNAGNYYVNLYIYDIAATTNKLTKLTLSDLSGYVIVDGKLEFSTGSAQNIYLSDVAAWSKKNLQTLQSQFSYWSLDIDDKAPYSFNGTYSKIVSAIPNTELNLILVINDTENNKNAVVSISQKYATDLGSGSYKLSFTLSQYISEGTVNESGFIYSTKPINEDDLVLNGSGVYKHLSGKTENELIYTMNATAPNQSATVYIRAYVIYTENGTIKTIYSDMTSGSYSSMTKVG